MTPARPPAPRSTRRLSHDRVVREALRLARAEGLPAVTMRRVAESLGTSAMALYRHVDNREALLVAMLDEVAKGISLPEPVADPRSEITVLMTAIHDALHDEPWAVRLLITDRLAGPSILPVVERIMAALLRAGLSPRDAMVAYGLLWHYTAGELLSVHHDVPDSFGRRMVAAADPAAYPALVEVFSALPPGPAGDWFPENLQRLLDGLLKHSPGPR
ncbi:TetR family transcriptional regulator [Streptomyces spinoverrucosus]|uniref:TetR family transcriptional regulator n=1 Tax=Streptomyces spinoverrucosus TaxID=284043 RepID=A0A4Y3VWC9_9ACTN|nr:TetR/AcrR family transcriptional regulator [Streptomyces spinoverrucosus]GEC09999.1 TetR family transcriptional regulator [Streptomyces spinoverrucosus]GHB75258.1 TetR family transcriptional regulator [Streptomyces spinoverrucosus]